MKEKFVNPYNFIKFPAEKAQAYTEEDRHTGVIEYSIKQRRRYLYQIRVLRKRSKRRIMHRSKNINLMISFLIRN